ncbi:IclR family transcriptional regulator [Nocardia sp. NPDC059239]|uniref:IclR family transcriptional regulator n=1 Tax=unclassified Nocardia TaxID=2637762 RepID=UPI00367CB28A
MAEISKTADQALTILLAVAERGPRSSAQLARDLRLNRTVVHRLLSTLRERGFVTRAEGGYIPGISLLRLSERVQPELRALGRIAMTRLAEEVGESIVMHVRDGEEAVVLEQVVSTGHIVRVEHTIGSRHPLEDGASGRAILAFLDDASVRRVVERLRDPEVLLEQFDRTRRLGYSLSHDELQQGVHGLAVPVFGDDGRAVASVGILVPTSRSEDLTRHADVLLTVGAEISNALSRSVIGGSH